MQHRAKSCTPRTNAVSSSMSNNVTGLYYTVVRAHYSRENFHIITSRRIFRDGFRFVVVSLRTTGFTVCPTESRVSTTVLKKKKKKPTTFANASELHTRSRPTTTGHTRHDHAARDTRRTLRLCAARLVSRRSVGRRRRLVYLERPSE